MVNKGNLLIQAPSATPRGSLISKALLDIKERCSDGASRTVVLAISEALLSLQNSLLRA